MYLDVRIRVQPKFSTSWLANYISAKESIVLSLFIYSQNKPRKYPNYGKISPLRNWKSTKSKL